MKIKQLFVAIRNTGLFGMLFLLTFYTYSWINVNAAFVYNPTPWQDPFAAAAIFHSVISSINYLYVFFGMSVGGEIASSVFN